MCLYEVYNIALQTAHVHYLNFQILARQAPSLDVAGIETGNDWLIGIFLNASVQSTSAEVMSACPASLLLAW